MELPHYTCYIYIPLYYFQAVTRSRMLSRGSLRSLLNFLAFVIQTKDHQHETVTLLRSTCKLISSLHFRIKLCNTEKVSTVLYIYDCDQTKVNLFTFSNYIIVEQACVLFML